MKNKIAIFTSICFIMLCNIATSQADTTSKHDAQQSLAACDADFLDATYDITKANKNSVVLRLVRQKNEVAHQYKQTGITETWQLIKGQRIKLTRFFDNHARAIEYQPGEQIHGRSEKDWSYRHQLLSQSMLEQFTMVSAEGEGCQQQQLKRFSNKNVVLSIVWLPHQRLVKEFTVVDKETGKELEHWKLTSVTHNTAPIRGFFTQRHNYYATDFADIGDDHTDPFLTQMLNLGFIEHASSGFYNQEGKPIQGGHAH